MADLPPGHHGNPHAMDQLSFCARRVSLHPPKKWGQSSGLGMSVMMVKYDESGTM